MGIYNLQLFFPFLVKEALMKKLIYFVVIILIFSSYNVFSQQAKDSDDSVQPLDVRIKGKAKDLVDIEKTPPEIEIDLESIVSSSAGMTEDLLEKGIVVPSKSDYEQFNYLGSNQATKPHLPDLSEPPLVRFLPRLSEIAVKHWELIITDEKGNSVRTLKGKGLPTRVIEWDGIDKKGEIINVGMLYSYRFVATDAHDNPSTVEGEPFILAALKYKKGKKIIIEVDNKKAFKEDSSEISEKAELILQKAIDILREYSHYPFKINLYVQDENSPLAREQMNSIKNLVAENLPLMPEEINTRLLKQQDRGTVTAFIITK